MAEAKTQATSESVAAFIERIPDEARRQDCRRLVTLMQTATGEDATMWGASIVGFGRYRYRYDSGREGEWPIIGFAPRKNDLTLYITPGFESFADLMAKLGKYRTGKACLYVKKLADVDEAVLARLLAASTRKMAPQRVKP
jgi:hypothetical protein